MTTAVQRKIDDTIALFEDAINNEVKRDEIIKIINNKIIEINNDRRLKKLSSPEVIDAFGLVSNIYTNIISLSVNNTKDLIEFTINEAVTKASSNRTPSSIATKYIYETYLSNKYTDISLVISKVPILSYKKLNQTKLNNSIKAIINNTTNNVNQKEYKLNDLLRTNINYKNYTVENQNIFNAKFENAKIKIHRSTENTSNSLRSLGNYINSNINSPNNKILNNFNKYKSKQVASIDTIIKKYSESNVDIPKLKKLIELLSTKDNTKFQGEIKDIKNIINTYYIKKFSNALTYKEIKVKENNICERPM